MKAPDHLGQGQRKVFAILMDDIWQSRYIQNHAVNVSNRLVAYSTIPPRALIHASILKPSALEDMVKGMRKFRIGSFEVSRTTCRLYLQISTPSSATVQLGQRCHIVVASSTSLSQAVYLARREEGDSSAVTHPL